MEISRQGLKASFWIVFGVILCTGMFILLNLVQMRLDASRVIHTREVLQTLQATLSQLADAEVGEQGYLLSGDRRFLGPYVDGLARISDDLKRLRALVEDNPRQELRLDGLEQEVHAKFDLMAEMVKLKEQDPSSGRWTALLGQARADMDIIHDQMAAMDQEEQTLLRARTDHFWTTVWTAVGAGLLAVILGVAGTLVLLQLVLRNLNVRDDLEREAERHRQWLQVTLHSIGDGLITTDLDGRVTILNPVAEQLTGWSANEAIGQPLERVFQIINEETGKPADNPVWRVLREGIVLGLVNHTALVHTSGRVTPIQDSAAPIRDADGKIVGTVLVFNDVTEKRKAEVNLAQSELRFRKLTELSPIAVWVNRSDRIELANPEACRLMGANGLDQLEGRSIFDIWHPDSHEKVRARLRAGMGGHIVQRSEETIIRLDGSVRIMEVSSAPFEDANGFALQCVLMDVTERNQAELALRESEERFRRLFDTAPVPYALFHKSGPTLAVNRRFQETFGYDLAEIPTILEWWRRAYPDPAIFRESADYWEGISAQAAEGHPSVMLSGRRQITCKDGTVRSVEVSGLLQQDQVLTTFFDLTDRLREEEDRRKVEERMVQAQRLEALGVLVAGVAHNFNNILAIIMGTASMQEHLAKDPSQLEALRIIDTACQRGRGLVRSLTHFARPSVPNQVPIEMGAFIGELRLLLGNTARKNISIVEVLLEEPAWILGDPGSFSSALMNLCLNSLDAMPHGGTLTLRTVILPGDMVEVSVEDTGEGMAPEILARVTEPFFTTKAVDKGTGLGLSITHGVIKAHGGTMEIASRRGQGTQVKVRVPRHSALTGEPTSLPPERALGFSKVLVVDDEEEVRTMLARMLTMAGAGHVKTVASGLEALESLDSGDIPDLIILDYNMPGLDGTQTTALIRSSHRDIPIIISSGVPDLEGRDGFNQEKVGVISKPFTLEEIRKKLAELRVGTG